MSIRALDDDMIWPYENYELLLSIIKNTQIDYISAVKKSESENFSEYERQSLDGFIGSVDTLIVKDVLPKLKKVINEAAKLWTLRFNWQELINDDGLHYVMLTSEHSVCTSRVLAYPALAEKNATVPLKKSYAKDYSITEKLNKVKRIYEDFVETVDDTSTVTMYQSLWEFVDAHTADGVFKRTDNIIDMLVREYKTACPTEYSELRPDGFGDDDGKRQMLCGARYSIDIASNTMQLFKFMTANFGGELTLGGLYSAIEFFSYGKKLTVELKDLEITPLFHRAEGAEHFRASGLQIRFPYTFRDEKDRECTDCCSQRVKLTNEQQEKLAPVAEHFETIVLPLMRAKR